MAAINGPNPSDGVNILLQPRADHPDEAAWIDGRIGGSLVQLGFVEED